MNRFLIQPRNKFIYIFVVDLGYRESLNTSRTFGITLFPESRFIPLNYAFWQYMHAMLAAEFQNGCYFSKTNSAMKFDSIRFDSAASAISINKCDRYAALFGYQNGL